MISNQFIKIVQNNTTRIFFFFSMNTPNRSNDWVLIPGSIIRVCYGKKKREKKNAMARWFCGSGKNFRKPLTLSTGCTIQNRGCVPGIHTSRCFMIHFKSRNNRGVNRCILISEIAIGARSCAVRRTFIFAFGVTVKLHARYSLQPPPQFRRSANSSREILLINKSPFFPPWL